MRALPAAASVGLTLAMAGCATSGGLHPDGTPISPDSLATSRTLANVKLSPAAWPEADWWTSLGDSQLNALIGEALHDNPSLAEADARARQAQAEASEADAERKPEVNAGAGIYEVRVPTTLPPIGKGHTRTAKNVYARFSWDLDLWGGKRAAWEAALGQQRAEEVDAQAARIELSANVARAYVQLGYAYARQDVATAELGRATDVLKLTQKRLGAGIDSQVQLKQSDAEVAGAQERKAQADRAIDAAQSALSVLLGKGPDRGLAIARPQLMSPDVLHVPADLPVELLGHRADLVAARWRVEAAGKQVDAAKTEFLPNINIGAMAGLVMLGGGNLFTAESRFYQVGPAISLPIFDGGRRRANLNGKDALFDLAVAHYNNTLVRAVNEVCDFNNALSSLGIQIDAQQRATSAADDAWTLAEKRYKAGVGSYLEALIVRQQLLIDQERMAALHAEQIDYSVQIIQALGGGFRPGQTVPDPPTVAADAKSPALIHHRS